MGKDREEEECGSEGEREGERERGWKRKREEDRREGVTHRDIEIEVGKREKYLGRLIRLLTYILGLKTCMNLE